MLETLTIGQYYKDENGEAKIVCFVEKNWIVARRKGCAPFLMTINDFAKRFIEVPNAGG